jgi:hypothetical protein
MILNGGQSHENHEFHSNNRIAPKADQAALAGVGRRAAGPCLGWVCCERKRAGSTFRATGRCGADAAFWPRLFARWVLDVRLGHCAEQRKFRECGEGTGFVSTQCTTQAVGRDKAYIEAHGHCAGAIKLPALACPLETQRWTGVRPRKHRYPQDHAGVFQKRMTSSCSGNKKIGTKTELAIFRQCYRLKSRMNSC